MFQIRWLWKNLSGHKLKYCFGMLLSLMSILLIIINPIIISKIADDIIIGKSLPDGTVIRETEKLLPYVIIMIACTFMRTAAQYFSVILCEVASQRMIVKIRDYLYRNLQVQDPSFYDRNRKGDLMTTINGDLDLVRHMISYLSRNLFEAAATFILAVSYFFTRDVFFTLAIISIAIIIYSITYIFSKKVRPLFVDLRSRLSFLNSVAQENISANRVVKAFAREDYEIEKFKKINADYKEANITVSYMWLKFFPFIEILIQTLSVVTLVLGGYFVIKGNITLGTLSAFTSLMWMIASPIRMLGILLNDLQRFFVSSSKVIEIYYHHPSIINRYNAKFSDERFRGDIEFKNTSLEFNKKVILDNINMKIKGGSTLAILGNTGAGKSLMAGLVPRLYDATGGSVLVDGTNVKDWDLTTLRKNIGIASQEPFLFSDTVDSNIAYGNEELSEESVKHFALLAGADFVYKMSDGFNTIVGERGVGLSGGQKQRLALARALAVKPAILILDDTTSAVDFETEKYIQNSLDNLDFECTKIIIAQRISMIKNADHIIVLENGKIFESGTHKELLEKKGMYYDVYRLQTADADDLDGGMTHGTK